MKRKVIAIGLDAADPEIVDKWIAQGYLSNLAQLKSQGVSGKLTNIEYYRAEAPWTIFITGCLPEKTGYWGPQNFHPDNYQVSETGAYDFQEYPPFYALSSDHQITVFDMPQTRLFPEVQGLQVLGWGSHSQQGPSCSKPDNLLQNLIDKYGKHPAYGRDWANCYDFETINTLKTGLLTGISQRKLICQELLGKDWDLFLTIFSETHSGGHYFWHLSQPHPLSEMDYGSDPLLEIFQSADRAIGDILDQISEETYVVVFSAHGMTSNFLDVPSMFFLAEFMYRWNFPKQSALAKGNEGEWPSPPRFNYYGSDWNWDYWQQAIWNQRAPGTDLESPEQQIEKGEPTCWQPANWYRPVWHKMKAFALPSYSDGYIRINLKGRDTLGRVIPSDYHEVCNEICASLTRLIDVRTGKLMVKEVIRTRQDPTTENLKNPPADLIVKWQEDNPTDVVESPDFGRIGPVPYLRTGSHRSKGFVTIKGPQIEAGMSLYPGKAQDLPATLLEIMGIPIPDYFDGQSLIKIR
ncbi:MAG: nucleotide pyrophosphatase [Moorea sp. SIO4G2]|nr:nucleotide pyrophosphatase [Moorena sp. SIO4G2]